jgi:hypothetical protein
MAAMTFRFTIAFSGSLFETSTSLNFTTFLLLSIDDVKEVVPSPRPSGLRLNQAVGQRISRIQRD